MSKRIMRGDAVGFKTDVENYGEVVGVDVRHGQRMLKIKNPHGFSGRELEGLVITWQPDKICWREHAP